MTGDDGGAAVGGRSAAGGDCSAACGDRGAAGGARGSPRRRTGIGLLRRILLDTCALVVPVECACGAEGTYLCGRCARMLAEAAPTRVDSVCSALQTVVTARVTETDPAAPAGVDYRSPLPVLAMGEYAGNLQRLVLDWKNRGQFIHTPVLGRALAPAVREFSHEHGHDGLRLAPVPSRLGSRLRRGEDHTGLLVKELSALTGIAAAGIGGRLSSSQSGKGARQRRRRHFEPDRRPYGAGDTGLVLVDDVVTTGSTLRAIAEGLRDADVPVIGAVVLASARWPQPAHTLLASPHTTPPENSSHTDHTA